MDLNAFLRYWALTLAVFVFYLFAIVVASLDVFADLAEAARKRRAQRKPTVLDPNPMASRSVAGTIFPGPGQQPDGRREWVARLVEDLVRQIEPRPPVQTLVLEDSKGHFLVHFSGGQRLETYRVDRSVVEAAMAGETGRMAELTARLRGHLVADFLGDESARPARTTELAREAKPAPAPSPAAPSPTAPTVPSAPAPPGPADVESMSREERLAAARAKAEALRAARQAQKPPTD